MPPEIPKAPSLQERLPDLILAIEQLIARIQKPQLSSLPLWEQLHHVAHRLKGLVGILPAPKELSIGLVRLADAVAKVCQGYFQIPDGSLALSKLQTLAEGLKTGLLPEENVSWLEAPRSEALPTTPWQPPIGNEPEVMHRWAEYLRLSYSLLSGQKRCVLEEIGSAKSELMSLAATAGEGEAFFLFIHPVLGEDGDRIFLHYAVAVATAKKAVLISTLTNHGYEPRS